MPCHVVQRTRGSSKIRRQISCGVPTKREVTKKKEEEKKKGVLPTSYGSHKRQTRGSGIIRNKHVSVCRILTPPHRQAYRLTGLCLCLCLCFQGCNPHSGAFLQTWLEKAEVPKQA